jgi:hypothetical protein
MNIQVFDLIESHCFEIRYRNSLNADFDFIYFHYNEDDENDHKRARWDAFEKLSVLLYDSDDKRIDIVTYRKDTI